MIKMEQEKAVSTQLTKMQTKNLIFLLLVCFFQYSCCSCSVITQPFILPSSSPVHMQGSKKAIHTKDGNSNNYSGGNGVSQKGKLGLGVGSRGRGGNAGSNGGGGGDGEGSHPNTQGGGGARVVPWYAGAANRHPNNHHRNAGSCIKNRTGTSIVLAAISLGHVLYINFNKL